MEDILNKIVASKRQEVAASRLKLSFADLRAMSADTMASRHSMKLALKASRYGIIAEFKRKSPSRGWIHRDADFRSIIPAYCAAGASAVSILTDREYFGGSLDYISRIRPEVDIPILRKDFIIDEYQLYEARLAGADAVLLIAACLSRREYQDLLGRAHELGLEVLLELHSPSELDYAAPDNLKCLSRNDQAAPANLKFPSKIGQASQAGLHHFQPADDTDKTAERSAGSMEMADMVGINNRHLGSFATDVAHSFELAAALAGRLGVEAVNPGIDASRSGAEIGRTGAGADGVETGLTGAGNVTDQERPVMVSESGISSPETLLRLREAGFRGFLMGETFMKEAEPGKALQAFIGQLKDTL